MSSNAYIWKTISRKCSRVFVKNIEENSKFDLIEKTSDYLDTWREIDSFYADLLSKNIFLSVKKSREWQIFQWFDGITPQYHWSLETKLDEVLIEKQFQYIKTRPGCYKITNINNLLSKIQTPKFSCGPYSLTQNEPKLNVALILGGG